MNSGRIKVVSKCMRPIDKREALLTHCVTACTGMMAVAGKKLGSTDKSMSPPPKPVAPAKLEVTIAARVINNRDSVLIRPPAEVFYVTETEYTARPVALTITLVGRRLRP